MHNAKLKYYIADLEYAISVHLRPSFLCIIIPEENSNEINVIISCAQFKGKSIQQRIATVFQLTSKYCSAIMEEYLLIVKAFDGPEIEEFLDDVFTEELE